LLWSAKQSVDEWTVHHRLGPIDFVGLHTVVIERDLARLRAGSKSRSNNPHLLQTGVSILR